MDIQLDRNDTTPLYRQIVAHIMEGIALGRYPAGTSLPPERKLAAHLGVNRTTVVAAYRDLVATGRVEARVGHGTWVCADLMDDANAPPSIVWQTLFTPAAGRLRESALRDMMSAIDRPSTISLGAGTPAPDLFPIAEYREAVTQTLETWGAEMFRYGEVAGWLPLRRELAAWMAQAGVHTTADQIVVLHGSQQGLDMLTRVLVEPGDAVVVESPTYLGALQTFRGAGARLLPVPLDAHGMQIEILEQTLVRHRPKFIYTLPTFQNPTGATMSLGRRHALLALARRYGIPIVEDDPYGDLRYEGDPLPRLAALDTGGGVIHLSTMSKIFLPGLRLAWLSAPLPVVEAITMARQTMDVHPNSAAQRVLHTFLTRGWLAAHIAELRPAYAARRDVMLAALAEYAPPGMTWSQPEGGYFLWCRLPPGVRARALATEAAREGVSFVAGDVFSPDGGGRDHLRLNFTGNREAEIVEGVRRLSVALRRLQRDPVYDATETIAAARPVV